MRGFHFAIPNLPKPLYEYLRQVGEAQGLSPWQVVVLGLRALQHLAREDPPKALELTEGVKRDYPKP